MRPLRRGPRNLPLLRPLYPVPEYGSPFSDSNAELIFVDVNSLQPTLRWERFEAGSEAGIDLASVRYDIKVWDVQSGAAVGAAYARVGLAETFHRLETFLRPQTQYFWSVRAKFVLDGQVRATPWARSEYPGGRGPTRASCRSSRMTITCAFTHPDLSPR